MSEQRNQKRKQANTRNRDKRTDEPAARKVGRIAAFERLHVGARNRALFDNAAGVLVINLEETAGLSRRVAHRVLAKEGCSARASALRVGAEG